MPDQTASTDNRAKRIDLIHKFADWFSSKLDAKADIWLDKLGSGRRNLLGIRDVFTLNDDRQALIADLHTLGKLPLGYPKTRALNTNLPLIGMAVIAVAISGMLAATQFDTSVITAIGPAILLAALIIAASAPLASLDRRYRSHAATLVHRLAAIEFGVRHGCTQPGMSHQQIRHLFAPFLQRDNNENHILQMARGKLTVGNNRYPYTIVNGHLF